MREVLLLADNNAEFREVFGKVLSKAGYKVIPASSPQETRNILRDTGIDLVILDLRLEEDDDEKDISGLEIAMDKALRRTPKIILTGYTTSPENVREALGLTPDELPPAASWVGKSEGPEALVKVIRNTLETWPSLRMSTIKVSKQIKGDHEVTRKQANYHYIAAAIVSVFGFLLIFLGIVLAWHGDLSIGVVGTTSGIIVEILVYLFFNRLDHANDRMDTYHRELLQTYWLEFLLATCEQLPSQKQVTTTEYVIRMATKSWFAFQPGIKTSTTVKQQKPKDK